MCVCLCHWPPTYWQGELLRVVTRNRVGMEATGRFCVETPHTHTHTHTHTQVHTHATSTFVSSLRKRR